MNMKYSALICAAGSGTRMKLGYNKVYAKLNNGQMIIDKTINVFLNDTDCEEVIVVSDPDTFLEMHNGVIDQRITLVQGGSTRQESVYHGLVKVKNSYVMIHDGARPFVNQDIIRRCMQEVQKYQACVVGMPVKDTIKIADEGGYAKQTPDRKNVWMIQTPQTFSYALIYEAYEEMLKTEDAAITDDAMVLERTKGKKSKLIEGSYRNIKITTPEDLLIANVYLQHPE